MDILRYIGLLHFSYVNYPIINPSYTIYILLLLDEKKLLEVTSI